VAGTRTLLYYDGINWQVVWSRDEPLLGSEYVNPRALFMPDNNTLVVSALSGINSRLYKLSQYDLNKSISLAEHGFFSYGMAGAGLNDLMIINEFIAIEHFDGKNIHLYNESQGYGILKGIGYYNNNYYIVGCDASSERSIFIRGKRN
jgi:hypothetical protein